MIQAMVVVVVGSHSLAAIACIRVVTQKASRNDDCGIILSPGLAMPDRWLVVDNGRHCAPVPLNKIDGIRLLTPTT